MNLHSITPNVFTVAMTMYPVGANGHHLTRIAHLWLVNRGTPPPLGEERPPWARAHTWWRPARYWWHPYEPNIWPGDEASLTPLCGRLKSRSRDPHLSIAYDRDDVCETCIDVATARGYKYGSRREILRDDPWTTIPQEHRGTTPDPLTGE